MFRSFDNSYLHTCALAHIKNKSMVGCWGNNREGQTNVPQHIYEYTNEFYKSNHKNKNAARGNKNKNIK